MNPLFSLSLTEMLTKRPGLALFLVLLVVWTIYWKGRALWQAAKRGQSTWFVVMLVLNTVGLLEIYYLYFVATKDTTKAE